MVREPFVVAENQESRLDFKISEEEEKYITGPIFNKGKQKNIEVFYNRENEPFLRIGPYAGIIQLGQRRIHFSTKVNTALFYMLSYLKSEEDFLYDPDTPIRIEEGSNFFDIIGRLFLNLLEQLMRTGLLKRYIRTDENLHFLRGKLLIKNQIRKNLSDKSRFFCEYEDLTFNNLENRIILSAINSLISLTRFNKQVKSELRRFEAILKDYVTLKHISPQEISKVRFSRINQHYNEIIKLSKLVLEERFIRSFPEGGSIGFNFIVNMNKVYEDFLTEIIEEVIREKFPELTVERQPRLRQLVKERTIVAKPDMILRKGKHEYPIIIDAKYKREDSNADYYQVIAYSLALRTSRICCLIYPHSEKSKISDEKLTLIRNLTGTNTDEVKLLAKTVDLSLENEDSTYEKYIESIKSQIEQILQTLVETPSTA